MAIYGRNMSIYVTYETVGFYFSVQMKMNATPMQTSMEPSFKLYF